MDSRNTFGHARGVIDEENRKAEYIISTFDRDSHKTRVIQSGWQLDRYKKNPVVSVNHTVWGDPCRKPDPDDVIGVSDVMLDMEAGQQVLAGIVTFEPRDINPIAEKVWRKTLWGSYSATSVGFSAEDGYWGEEDEARGRPNETYYISKSTLYEFSIVAIPSNPNTVKRSLVAQVDTALDFVSRQLPNVSRKNLETMTVRDILNELEGNPTKAAFQETTDAEKRLKAAEFIKQTYLPN